uniref:Uncharacterized protein n=1 Tax=Anguilla anguilla TaxID=7936 RepID=A0A0E9THU3_ANGAN
MFCYSLAHTDTLGSGPYLVNVYLFIRNRHYRRIYQVNI